MRLMFTGSLLSALLVLLLVSSPLLADEKHSKAELEQQLQQLDPRIRIVSLQAAPLAGFHEVVLNTGDLLYVHEAGRHFFAGSLLEINNGQLLDLTEQARGKQRQQAIQSVPANEQVVFPATGETRAVVQVFTDITCPYCVRLHEQIPELNRQGVEVRYLAFPRQGEQSPGFQQLVNVWCAADRQQAMNRAKGGQRVAEASCDNPVAAQYDLGRRQGIQGTPAILLPDGQLIPGFVPAQRLLSELGL